VVLPLPPEEKPTSAKPHWAAFIDPPGPIDRRHYRAGVTGARITPCGLQELARLPTLPGPVYNIYSQPFKTYDKTCFVD